MDEHYQMTMRALIFTQR